MMSARLPVALPSRLALFPLSGLMLLPFGHVPLNVFEPRYINLIDDALRGSRIFGVIQPMQSQVDPVSDDAELYTVGTAGRIVQFSDMSDGRYHITLEGLSRFHVTSEVAFDPARGYRQVDVDYAPYPKDPTPAEQSEGPGRERILDLMHGYFDAQEIEADWSAVSEAPYEALVSSLAMSCPFESGEKQALLECKNHEDRAQMLISLFEMSNEGGPIQGTLKH